MVRAAFIHSKELEQYTYPKDCPLSSNRAGKARQILESMDLLSGNGRREVPPLAPTREELERFHQAHYLDVLQKASDGIFDEAFLSMGLGTPDCPLFPGMYEYAVLACGATLQGAELILSDEVDVAFNPSGGYHHAGRGYAAGFCYVNDVVLGCMRLADAGKRVVYLDVDAHHGDGVQDAFYARSDVLTLSMHENGKTLYPGTGFEDEIGEGEGKGACVNIPLPVGTYDEAFLRAFLEVGMPVIHAHDPGVIVLQLGMDGLAMDPLAHLNLTNNVYADVIHQLQSLGIPILATGGGGYHVENTTRGWALAWSILSGAEPEEDLSIGMGGVMLESTEYQSGLRDRVLLTHGGQRQVVDEAIEATIEKLKQTVFPLLGINSR
jgi:acetoin utilization protein AcuC